MLRSDRSTRSWPRCQILSGIRYGIYCQPWSQPLIHLISPFVWPTKVCPCEQLLAPCGCPPATCASSCMSSLRWQALELPCDDWPPGCPKDQRALQISRVVRENREALHLVAMQLFGLTPSGARVLEKLLETEHTSREVLHVALSRPRTRRRTSRSSTSPSAACASGWRSSGSRSSRCGPTASGSRASTAAGPWT